MTSSSDDPSNKTRTGAGTQTGIDLGDDLLERTATSVGAPAHSRSSTEGAGPIDLPIDLDDQLASARILLNEGLVEEAKRVLRSILLADPGHLAARKKLEEIHESELKDLFGPGESRSRKPRRAVQDLPVDTEELMRQLDQDLGLGTIQAGDPDCGLFAGKEQFEEFIRKLDIKLLETSMPDRIDLGIAFMEMELYDVAARLFQVATRDSEHEKAATSLLAQALIAGGRPFEASLSLEPMLRSTELNPGEKIEFIYLMGRAQEKLGNREIALQWYRQAAGIERDFRDLAERIRFLSSVPGAASHTLGKFPQK